MDVQRFKYDKFVRELPALLKLWLGIDVTIDPRASVMEVTGKRYVTPFECEVRGLSYAFMVVSRSSSPYVVMQVPLMLDDGTFLIRGKRRVVMLLRKRARVPVRLSKGLLAVNGGKLDIAKRTFIPSFGVKSVPIEKSDKVGTSSRMLKIMCDRGMKIAFDADDVVNMRIWTVDRLMEALFKGVITQAKAKKGATWPEQYVTSAIFSAFASGNWRGMSLTGVTQLANMTNHTSLKSQLCNVLSGYTNASARFVHSSTYKYFCVSQTPEGQKVGLVHTLVEGVCISDHTDEMPTPTVGDMPWFHNGEYQGVTGSIAGAQQQNDTVWTWSDAGRMSPGNHMLGHTARHIPFANHNQGPRVSYYCSMAKQAMSDTGSHRLVYAQRPMVGPCHEETSGCNVILAINCMGYNQEDALVASKGALERGLFRSLQIDTYTANADNINGIAVGQQLAAGTAIMKDTITAKRGASQTTVTVAAEGDGTAQVVTAALRMPVRGDKLCNRHGQKGVIGAIVPDEDMPFTAEGIRPDLVINAHALPSRMTVAQIMEMAGGKIDGTAVDGTPFGNMTVEELYSQGGSGRETMYDGTTGLPLQEKIFIAPCWYQRLTHVAQEKCYARGATGLTDRLTNQPTAGRKNSGGMRLGEMERDVLLSGGATQVLRERMDCIGTTTWDKCTICSKHICHHIFASRSTPALKIPHASGLLAMELAAMGIEMSLDG